MNVPVLYYLSEEQLGYLLESNEALAKDEAVHWAIADNPGLLSMVARQELTLAQILKEQRIKIEATPDNLMSN
jgi:hypothetical protein